MATITCFGELLLRLTAPGRERLLQTLALDVHVGGAEANVAVSLSRFGHQASMVGVVPDNPLGAAARAELSRHGVDVSRVRSGDGRMGLYFLEQGAILRPSEVTYDRAGSAFAIADPAGYDWGTLLAGAQWLHLSGVTPALGERTAQAAIAAATMARQMGVRVSFDGNFRPKLWRQWRGDAPAILRELMGRAQIVFADYRDITVVLGREFAQTDPFARVDAAAHAAFEAFPQLEVMACTHRTPHSVDHHTLSAQLCRRDGASVHAGSLDVAGIVDRIGGGDAFAAGLLHGLIENMADSDALTFALAAAVCKHSLPGDFNLVSAAEVRSIAEANGFDVRR
ncbi:sugar kinase [Pseudoxanthomonas helianthi]|uniref:Sugar kinase n=1 Tax=Pseudoxanthomonas helianthi TaxID=1453541 RepID=A0A940X6A5_9GAMM|nr:sugar kinase [Pseudoxanthomonas helianthi]MBP3985732.1 sugar kinase [Pseudoxanthomonas helianthi]